MADYIYYITVFDSLMHECVPHFDVAAGNSGAHLHYCMHILLGSFESPHKQTLLFRSNYM